jgi:hypothetical protein
MAFSPLSLAIGVGVAYLVPMLAKSFRPLAVEATAMGLGMLADARRIAAEQMETLEDIAAEARARRDEIDAQADRLDDEVGDADDSDDAEVGAIDGDEVATRPNNGTRARRRPASRQRSQPNS